MPHEKALEQSEEVDSGYFSIFLFSRFFLFLFPNCRRKRHGMALEQSKKGCHKVTFDNNKRTDQTEFIPGAENDFDMLIAKVRAAVDKVRERGKDVGVGGGGPGYVFKRYVALYP